MCLDYSTNTTYYHIMCVLVVTNFYLHYLSCVCYIEYTCMIYIYNLIRIIWSSVTARLRNSHSTYLHTPGVTTRKPLPVVIQIPGLCRVLGRTSLFTQPMVLVFINTFTAVGSSPLLQQLLLLPSDRRHRETTPLC